MKQYITVKQLKELSEEQVTLLKEHWKPIDTDRVLDEDGKEDWFMFQKGNDRILPLLSIGNMFEILNNYHSCVKVQVDVAGFFSEVKGGRLNCQVEEELCDALWEAIKYIIRFKESHPSH